MTGNRIILAENMTFLSTVANASIPFIYIDPPFNTGRLQSRNRIRVHADEGGDRTGFAGRRYRTERVGSAGGYEDRFEDYSAFLAPRLAEARRILSPGGSLFVHLDAREVHYIKVLLDELFGRAGFLNEIIWAYDFGGRSRSRWPAKHDTILWYSNDPARAVFNREAVDRIPYMAPGLVGPEKAARGKSPTDVWWQTIVPTNGRERTGYPTQKPLAILRRLVAVHTRPGDTVLDFFAGSGTTGEAAGILGRPFVMVDRSIEACRVMARRLDRFAPRLEGFSSEL